MIIALFLTVFMFAKSDSLPLQKVKGYSYIEPGEPQCRALSPQCGYCAGKVIGKDCWVWSKNEANQTRLADECTEKDWQTGNCVPAGRCAPAGKSDALIDCATKDYDSKYRTDL